MAHSPLLLRAPPAAPIADRSLPDVVLRAKAILARETPKVPTASALIGAGREKDDPKDDPIDAMGEIHRRAAAVLSDLFGLLGAPRLGTDSPAQSALDVPWRRTAAAALAGGSAAIPLRLDNLEDHPVNVSFYSSDLLSDAGASIPSFAVSFEPPTLNIGAGQQGAVSVKVGVPPQTVAGAYSGLVQAVGLTQVKVVITVEVD